MAAFLEKNKTIPVENECVSVSDVSVEWSDKMSRDNILYGGRRANAAFTVQPVRKEDIAGMNVEVT